MMIVAKIFYAVAKILRKTAVLMGITYNILNSFIICVVVPLLFYAGLICLLVW